MRLTLSWAALVPGGSGSMADPLFMVQPGLLGANGTWSGTIAQMPLPGLEVNPPEDPRSSVPKSPRTDKGTPKSKACEFEAAHVSVRFSNIDSGDVLQSLVYMSAFAILLQFLKYFLLTYHAAQYLSILWLLVLAYNLYTPIFTFSELWKTSVHSIHQFLCSLRIFK